MRSSQPFAPPAQPENRAKRYGNDLTLRRPKSKAPRQNRCRPDWARMKAQIVASRL